MAKSRTLEDVEKFMSADPSLTQEEVQAMDHENPDDCRKVTDAMLGKLVTQLADGDPQFPDITRSLGALAMTLGGERNYPGAYVDGVLISLLVDALLGVDHATMRQGLVLLGQQLVSERKARAEAN